MKSLSLRLALATIGLLTFLPGCKKDKDVLKNSYTGTLVYEYSRGFPSFTAISTLYVNIDKQGNLTSGASEPDSFDEEAIKYDGTEPVMKIHFAGTISLDEAEGHYEKIDEENKVLVYIHSVVEGVLEIYGWDDDIGFILLSTQNVKYEDSFADGTWEFSLDDATITGSSIMTTLPDIEGQSTYRYTLDLASIP